MRRMLYNKRGQIGETITWVVAAIVIFLLLVIYIYVTSLLVKTNNSFLSSYSGKYFPDQNSIDLFTRQSVISFLLTPEDSGTVYSNLRSAGEFNQNNGGLAYSIFNGLYRSYYVNGIFAGVSDSPSQVDTSGNKYFTAPTTFNTGTPWTGPIVAAQAKVNYFIDLTNGKYFDAIFSGGGQK